MQSASQFETQHLAYGLTVINRNIYVADGNEGFYWVTERVGFDLPGNSLDIEAQGNTAYIASEGSGIRILNIDDENDIGEIGFYDTPGEARKLCLQGNTIYVADGDNFGIYDCNRIFNNDPPRWTEVPDQITADEEDQIEVRFTAEDPDDDEITLEMTNDNLPEEAEFEDVGNGVGIFRWETDREDADEYEATFVVSDGDFSDEVDVEIIITDVNEPPIWTQCPEDTISVAVREFIEFFLVAEDPNDDDIAIEIHRDVLPDEARFTDIGNGSGAFYWRPGLNDAGLYYPTFTVTDGELDDFTEVIIIVRDVEGVVNEPDLPLDYKFYDPYPNPFNSSTLISFESPTPTVGSIGMYSANGNQVMELYKGKIEAGKHTLLVDSANLSPGIYFIHLRIGNKVFTKKVVLMK